MLVKFDALEKYASEVAMKYIQNGYNIKLGHSSFSGESGRIELQKGKEIIVITIREIESDVINLQVFKFNESENTRFLSRGILIETVKTLYTYYASDRLYSFSKEEIEEIKNKYYARRNNRSFESNKDWKYPSEAIKKVLWQLIKNNGLDIKKKNIKRYRFYKGRFLDIEGYDFESGKVYLK